jgi:osmotically-inducible protein OsmY
MKTKEELKRDVNAELEWEPNVDATAIAVFIEDGVVKLNGSVPSYADRCEAERCVGRVYGVKAVDNELHVIPLQPEEPSDGAITSDCNTKLALTRGLRAGAITVTVFDGYVRLTGDVERPYQKLLAEEAIRDVSGVRGVRNSITVRPQATPAAIRDRIEEALRRSAAAEARRLDVRIDGDLVTLRGNVRTCAERLDAERAASVAPGIRHVENLIVVVPHC